MNYLDSFRIVCWKACTFSEERWKLGPKYYCPTCTLKEKDLEEGCPKCPLTDLFMNCLKRPAKEEIVLRGGLKDGLTIDKLLTDYWTVSLILGDNRDRISKRWDVAFVSLVRIVLQERAQQKYANDWNQWKEMQAKK